MKRRLLRLAASLAFALALLPAARAEVWGYVDGQGIAHFAADKLDDRYELFFRGAEAGDAADARTPRAVTVPTSQPRLLAFFEVSPTYKLVREHLKEASRANGIDAELLQALIATESGFDAHAVSPRGAVGLMQVMPATAQRYGVSGDGKTPLARKLADPRTNIRTGSKYLRHLLDLFEGKVDLALAAYNAGEGAVQRAGNRVPDFPETRNYVKTVLQLYALLKPPAMGARVIGQAQTPHRLHVELPVGGAIGRGNLPLRPVPGVPLAAAREDGTAASD
jgi:soluble lytic murein transglycosylase-like protein